MSNSKLPNGGFSLSTGSNYMLDGFQFDTEYNAGVYEKARLPEAKGLASLPSGMIPPDSPITSDLPTGVEVEMDLDLSDFTKDASEQLIPLVDHSWLASQPEEDLEGLRSHDDVLQQFAEGRFEHPQANQLKTLQDSWAEGSTDGLNIIPNTQREHAKYQNTYKAPLSKLPADDYRQRVEQASRKVAYGENPASFEGLTPETKKALSAEYGLHGRVYIKEASFPGLFNGRWDEVVNKRCATALYIVSAKKDCAFDRFLGRKVVASVEDISWREAHNTLMPKLETYGVQKMAGGDLRAVLKQAFVDAIEGRVDEATQASTWFQIQPDITKGLSLGVAKKALDQFEAENPYIESQEERAQTKTESRLERIASQLVSQSLVENDIVQAVLQSERTASQKITRLYEIASKPVKASTYEGQGKEASTHTPFKSRLDPNAKVQTASERESALVAEKCRQKVAKLIQQGFVTLDEVERVTKKASTAEGKLGEVLSFIRNKKDKVATYQGDVDNFEARLSTSELAQIQKSFFSRQASQTKEAYEKQVMGQIGALLNSGVVSEAQFESVLKKHASLEGRLQALYDLVSKPTHVKKASGQTGHYGAKYAKKAEIAYTASDWQKAQAKVSKLVETGLLSKDQVENISKSENPNEFVKKAFEMASKPSEAGQYQGEATAHVLGSKKSSAPSATELKVATWVRQKISEGSAGQELDMLIASRFNQNVLNEHSARIASIRAEHEGVSGHAYVDASAYMTKGIEGCDKGALIHRANQIPTLLKTAKCGSCVFNTGGSCQKYNKQIIASASDVVENKGQYQAEMIRLANAPDSERTASLFVNNYDEGEFGLQQDSNIDFSDAPTNEKVGNVLFGGFEF